MQITIKKDFRKGPRAAHARRDNFWMRKRIEAKLRYQDIADDTGLLAGTLSNYFSGSSMPSDRAIKIICDYFEVDPVKGKSEFMKIHEIWDAHNNKALLTCKKPGYVSRKKVATQTGTAEPTIEPTTNPTSYDIQEVDTARSEVAREIYGKVDYDTFIAVLNALSNPDKGSVGKLLYGTVDYDIYSKIISTIS